MTSSLAGKPPFATDHPDSYYQSPAPRPRVKQAPSPNPNNRTSAYNHYDDIMDEKNRSSGYGSLGMGLMNCDMDDDDAESDDKHRVPLSKNAALAAATGAARHPQTRQVQQQPISVVAPQPGYAAPIAALDKLSRPEPAATPEGRTPAPAYPFVGMGGYPDEKKVHDPPPFYSLAATHMPVPSTPHPLEAPMSPITPVFARPSKQPQGSDIKFTEVKPIMRGNTEGTLLPRRGERGDDFWRRFSMVVKDPTSHKESSWLTKTQNGTTRLSRWVWVVGLILLICAAGGIGVGWYISHKDTSHTAPDALGGSEDQLSTASSTTTVAATHGAASLSSSLHVSPTNTVANRDIADAEPTGYTAVPLHELTTGDDVLHQMKRHHSNMSRRRSKKHSNRTLY